MYAVETIDLTKYYSRGTIKALEDCSLQVKKSIIFGLLGPNGAGKTTLIKALLGILIPTRGEAEILGKPISDYSMHTNIGYLSENHRFPEFLSPNQVLYYYGKMCGLDKTYLNEKIPQLLKMVKLNEWAEVKIKKFSKGMMQRLGLAHALINDPQIIFLDEPTDGIDPIGRKEVRDILKKLKEQGKTVFLNSHLLSEVERLSDEVAILKDGHLLEIGSVEKFISVEKQFQLSLINGNIDINTICEQLNIPITLQNNFYNITVKDEQHLNQLIDTLRNNKTIIKAIIPRKITLEDYFIEVLEDNSN